MVGSAPHNIEELYAFVSEDATGTEGILGFRTGGTMMPMIASDIERIRSLILVADMACKQSGKTYRIRRFIPAEPCDVTEQFK